MRFFPAGRLRRIFLVVAVVFASGCSSTSIFAPYPSRVNPLIDQLKADRVIDISRCLDSGGTSMDSILYNMELGRIAQIQGDVDFSIKHYRSAMEAIRAADDKAKISASGALAQAGAILSNDNALPYRGDGYERVLLHSFQAMNYLVKKDVEGAGVEIRRANAEQEDALKRHGDELEDARVEAERNKLDPAEGTGRVYARFAPLDTVAGRVKNSFQNAYSFYLSGLVYELLNQPNDAYIDYKKALEIRPDNSYLQEDVARLARLLGMEEELEPLSPGLQPVEETGTGASAVPEAETGELLLFVEEDFVPQKEEVKIPVPVPYTGIVAIAFPIYRQEWSDVQPIRIMDGDDMVGILEPLCDTRALAVKALKEKVPVMVVRQMVRAFAKGIAARKSREKLGYLGELSALLYNYLSENADLRSWNTLPARVQVLRAWLPAGKHELFLEQDGAVVDQLPVISINSGARTLVRVIRAGNAVKTSQIVF